MPLRIREFRCITVIALVLLPYCASAQDTGAVELYRAGKYAAAVELLEREMTARPTDPDLFFLLGLSYQKLERHADAIGALRRTLSLQPGYRAAHLPLGIAYFEAELTASAESELRRAVELYPDNGSAWMFLGLAQQKLQQHREAISSFDRAAVLEPDLREASLANRDASRKIVERRRSMASPSSDTGASKSSGGESTAAPLPATSPATGSRSWRLSLQSGVEYDDNVTTSETDVTTGEDDAAALFEVSAGYTPLKNDNSEIELGYDFYQSLYSDLSDFDLQLHTAYLYGSRTVGSNDLGIEYRYTHADLGGDGFFSFHSIKPSFGFTTIEGTYHTLSYTYQNKDFKTDNARDADQHGANFDSYYFIADGAFAYAAFRYEDENTDGDEFDYLGYYINLGLSGTVTPFAALPTRIRVGYRYVLRDYSKITQSIGKERKDQRHIATLGIEQRLSRRFSALLDYQYIGADSNLPTSDFTESVVSLSLRFSL